VLTDAGPLLAQRCTPAYGRAAALDHVNKRLIGDLLAETELPAGSWSILPVANDRMPGLVQDERLLVISFTGSERVGYAIMDFVPRKHCTLELGGERCCRGVGRLHERRGS
jgi:aldehyde dehydrogenase (NAD+)